MNLTTILSVLIFSIKNEIEFENSAHFATNLVEMQRKN